MKACKFTWDDETVFTGFADGTRWNGFDNVAVTPEVRDEIAAYFEDAAKDRRAFGAADALETAEDLRAMEPGPDGLISLAGGFATSIVDDEKEGA